MKTDFNQRLKEGIMIADGAMGTMLQKMGLEQGECNEEWNLSRPGIIIDIHRQYIEAGADIILTNTFGGNPIKLKAAGLGGKTEEINTAAVSLAKEAVRLSKSSRKIFIGGDIGPSGEFLEPLGTISQKDLYDSFNVQASALLRGGVDIIVIETMTAVEEAEIALSSARESGLPVIVSMSFNKDKEGDNFHTMMGVGLEKFVETAIRLKADAIGVNCGGISFEMEEVIKRLNRLTILPLMAEANAGLPELVNGKTVYNLAPEKMGELALKFKKAGANIIGGCCGTTPGHIMAIARAVK